VVFEALAGVVFEALAGVVFETLAGVVLLSRSTLFGTGHSAARFTHHLGRAYRKH
jgi:hypothetical protein